MKSNRHIKMTCVVMTVLAVEMALTNRVWADQTSTMNAGPHHSFLGGPWELVVKMGLGGDGLRFPLTVSDESKPEKLDAIFPVLNSPIKVKLEQYIPDLTWETVAIKHPGTGIVAQLTIRGKNLEQEIWLSPSDPARQSVTSRIGSITIKRLHNPDTAETLMRKLTDPKAVGIISIWPEGDNRPFEYTTKVKETVHIPGTKYEVTVAEYLPHYSISTETKKVISQSDKPVNPAIKVLLHDGNKTSERWLWAKFPTSPHVREKLPLRMRFTDFDLSNIWGDHILAVASQTQAWLLSSEKGRKHLEKAVFGRSYPFADKAYTFSIEKIVEGAIIKNQWKNNTAKLLHPAIVATVQYDETEQQAVLELNKPFHLRTKSGVLVLLYRRRSPSSGMAQ
jgi:hypothetical protein